MIGGCTRPSAAPPALHALHAPLAAVPSPAAPPPAPTANVEPVAVALPVVPASVRALDVPGFAPAVLFSPAGYGLRPLLVATHGAGGSPEWDCEYWRRLTRDRVFVLCLRGTSLGSYPGFYYPDHRALERELIAADAAARASEPRISADAGLYAGFSQGSTMGSIMIGSHARAFPFLLLIESFQPWNVALARDFAKNGGKRVLIVCGSKECAKVGRSSVVWLKKGGVDARLELAPGAGHTPLGQVSARVEASLLWLLDDEPAWQRVSD